MELLATALSLGPLILITNGFIAVTKSYRVELYVAWVLVMVALGVLSTVGAETSAAHSIGYQVLLGFGGGIFFGAAYFPILAGVPVTENAHALSFAIFGRQFAGVSSPPCPP